MRNGYGVRWAAVILAAVMGLVGCPSSGGGDGEEGRGDVTEAGETDGDEEDATADGGETGSSGCRDRDGDGYGTGEDRSDCPACRAGEPGGCSRDCNDENPDVYPSAPERCNGIDDNCSGEADEAIGNSSCIENQECPLGGEVDPPQDGTSWGCATVDGLVQCVVKGDFDNDASCDQKDAWGLCENGSWGSVPEQCRMP